MVAPPMQFGVKKSQVTKALDALAEANKITCKVSLGASAAAAEHQPFAHCAGCGTCLQRLATVQACSCLADLQEFGKTKIYMPLQDAGPSLSKVVRLATFPAWWNRHLKAAVMLQEAPCLQLLWCCIYLSPHPDAAAAQQLQCRRVAASLCRAEAKTLPSRKQSQWQCGKVHCEHPWAARLQETTILIFAAALQDMDARQKSITELTEKVKETGETVRQLQTGEPCNEGECQLLAAALVPVAHAHGCCKNFMKWAAPADCWPCQPGLPASVWAEQCTHLALGEWPQSRQQLVSWQQHVHSSRADHVSALMAKADCMRKLRGQTTQAA